MDCAHQDECLCERRRRFLRRLKSAGLRNGGLEIVIFIYSVIRLDILSSLLILLACKSIAGSVQIVEQTSTIASGMGHKRIFCLSG